MDIKCPHCGTEYEIEEKEFGRFVKCESCGKGFVAGASTAQVNGEEKPVEDILGMRTNSEQEKDDTQQGTGQRIALVWGVGIAVFFAVLIANIVFAVFTYIVVGNQLGKVINRLDRLESCMEQMDKSRHYDTSQIYDRMGRMKLY